jgi:hypothetical protein
MFIIVLAVVIIISIIVYLNVKKKEKNKEGFSSSPDACIVSPESKKHSLEILQKLKQDAEKIYPDIKNIDFSLKPLECCKLEDSMTEDKKKMFICLRGKNGQYYNYNKSLQVFIHEISHLISKQNDPDHTSAEFLEHYNSLMNRAEELGLIDKSKLGIKY